MGHSVRDRVQIKASTSCLNKITCSVPSLHLDRQIDRPFGSVAWLGALRDCLLLIFPSSVLHAISSCMKGQSKERENGLCAPVCWVASVKQSTSAGLDILGTWDLSDWVASVRHGNVFDVPGLAPILVQALHRVKLAGCVHQVQSNLQDSEYSTFNTILKQYGHHNRTHKVFRHQSELMPLS
jgi:hypothetical protein